MKKLSSKKIIIIVLGVAAIGAGFYFAFRRSGEAEAAWYAETWLYRKKITIDHTKVKAKLSNFPVLASTTDNLLSTYAQSDGDDILFTSSDGTTKLNHEIEKYDSATGGLVSWIQTGLSSTTDTVLYMYYGNSSVGSQATTTGVWDDNFKGVWHMDDTGNESDSTKNSGDLTETSGTASSTAGQISSSRDFEYDDSEFLTHADSLSTDISGVDQSISVCAWIKRESDTAASNEVILSKWRMVDTPDQRQYALAIGTTDTIRFNVCSDGDATRGTAIGATTIDTGTWYYACGVYNDTDVRVYLNGSVDTNGSDNPDAFTSGIFDGTDPFKIGAWSTDANGDTAYFDGLIDEVRISNTARSAQWIETSYNNQSSPSTFMTWGDHTSKTVLYGAGGLPPILHLKFDEGYGTTAYDSSEYNQDATISGATWKNEADCKAGKCLSFDGTDDYAQIVDNDYLDLTASITIEAWVYDPPLESSVIANPKARSGSSNPNRGAEPQDYWIYTSLDTGKVVQITPCSQHTVTEQEKAMFKNSYEIIKKTLTLEELENLRK